MPVVIYQYSASIMLYTLTMYSGSQSGGGSYTVGTNVGITASAAPSGYSFLSWSYAFANSGSSPTLFTMPSSNVIMSASYSTLSQGNQWANQVVTNGGARPSAGTISAADTFWNSIKSAGLDSLMISVNIIAPDNLIAATTPLYSTTGNNPWTNNNFVDGDLSVNGLIGNGSSKWLDTGVATNGLNTNSVGLSFYAYDSQTSGYEGDAGATNGGAINAYLGTADICYWDCWNTGGGRIHNNNFIKGFFLYNRDSSTTSQIYSANSGNGWTAFASGTGQSSIGTSGDVGSTTIGFWRQNGNGYSGKTFSFCAVHSGLTSTQGQNLYNAVQALRVALGGGYR